MSYQSWNSDYYEHVQRAEKTQSERDERAAGRALWNLYKPYYPRMLYQKMSPHSVFYRDLHSYAQDEQQEWEYAGGGAWYRRLVSADINSSWEQISAGDVPNGLRWVNPVRSGPEYDALLEERQASRNESQAR